MFHLIRFAAGVLTGVAALTLIKSKKTKAGLEKAEDKLRDAAVSTLKTVEKASAKAREHLSPEEKNQDSTDIKEPTESAHNRSENTAEHDKSDS